VTWWGVFLGILLTVEDLILRIFKNYWLWITWKETISELFNFFFKKWLKPHKYFKIWNSSDRLHKTLQFLQFLLFLVSKLYNSFWTLLKTLQMFCKFKLNLTVISKPYNFSNYNAKPHNFFSCFLKNVTRVWQSQIRIFRH